jgi:predicted membrane protein
VNARPSDRLVIGLLLVALGVMFLLDTTNALGPEVAVVGTYWPALLIAWALWGMVGRGLALRLGFLLVLLVGVIFLLSNLGVWEWGIGELWPLLLVMVGLLLLFGNRLGRRRRRRWRRNHSNVASEVVDAVRARRAESQSRNAGSGGGPSLDFRASHVFGGGKEQVPSQDFQGGEVSAIFGGMELDLRDAGLAEDGAVLDLTVVCGGIELRVPRDWKLNVQVTTLFGGVDNKRSEPRPAEATGELTITGSVVCGGVEIKD